MRDASALVVSPIEVDIACGPVRNTVSSCKRGGRGLPAMLATGEVNRDQLCE